VVVAKGLCATHYQRVRRTGSTAPPPASQDLVNVTVRMPAPMLDVVDGLASRAGIERCEWIRATISEAVRRKLWRMRIAGDTLT